MKPKFSIITISYNQSTFIKGDFYHKHAQFNESNTACWDGELIVDKEIAKIF